VAKKFIFISCGQETVEELTLGKDIKALVEQHDMDGFLAQTVHSADELNKAVFEAIQACGGFCAVMHQRGEIKYSKYPPMQRSSVWIQQEIGLLMYRRFSLNQPIPIRVFSQKGILLEGVMKYSIANPIEFQKGEEVLAGVAEWLEGPEFHVDPILAMREELFERRIKNLNEEDWCLLKLIVVHSTALGDMPSKSVILGDLSALPENKGKNQKIINDSFVQCQRRLHREGLIEVDESPGGLIKAIGISKQWWILLGVELKNRGRLGQM